MVKKPKVVGIVPSRLGSVRVKAKSLRLIDGKPLLYYVLNSMKKCNIFDEIYVNSDSPLIGKVAERYGVSFYLRKKALASSDSMIDEYIYDFLKNIDCDILSVVNPTSPFLTSKEIESCIQNFIDSNFDTQLACEDIRTHCFLEGKPINFRVDGKHPRSQDLEPIKALNFAVTNWRSKSFIKQFESLGHAVYTGNLGFYSFEGFANIDIDWEEDFQLAKIIMENLEDFGNSEAEYDEVLSDVIKNNENIQN